VLPDGETEFIDLVADPTTQTPFDTLVDARRREFAASLLKTMDPTEADVLRRRFGMERGAPDTYDEIARQAGVSRGSFSKLTSECLLSHGAEAPQGRKTAQAASLLALIDPARMRFSFIRSRFAPAFLARSVSLTHSRFACLPVRLFACSPVRRGQFTAQNPVMCRIASARLALTLTADHNMLCGPATYRLSSRRRPLRQKTDRDDRDDRSVHRIPGQAPDFGCATTLEYGFTVVKPVRVPALRILVGY